MSANLKIRLFGAVLAAGFTGGLLYNWYLLIDKGYYYVKLSGLAPFGIVGGLIIAIFPFMAARPDPADKRYKKIAWVVIVISFLLGGLNFYLMDHYHR